MNGNGEFWKRLSIGMATLVLTLVGVVAGLAHQRINDLELFEDTQSRINTSYAIQIKTNSNHYEEILRGITDLKKSIEKLEDEVKGK